MQRAHTSTTIAVTLVLLYNCIVPLPGTNNSAAYDPMQQLEQIFVPQFEDILTMPSGRQLNCRAAFNAVEIRDKKEPCYQLYAQTVRKDATQSIWFNLNNLGWPEKDQRHPDLFPLRFMARSIIYFDSLAPPYRPIQRLLGTWSTEPPGGSVNYKQYQENLSAYGDAPTESEKARAALNTWTGRAAEDLGFPYVSKVHYLTPIVLEVFFDRDPFHSLLPPAK